MEKLPSSVRNTLWITSLRFQSAALARDWKNAKEILSDSPYNELYFSFSPYSWANSLVPRGVTLGYGWRKVSRQFRMTMIGRLWRFQSFDT
jgi:hypothetical protein